MNPALTVEEAGLTIRSERPEGVLSFLASRSKNSARAVIPSAGEVFNGCADVLNQLLINVIETRTRDEFRRTFATAFPKYLGLTLAMAHFASAVVPKDVLERLTRESICEMEADFRDKGLAAFGRAVRDQALFTVWTLRKIKELLTQLSAAAPEQSRHEDDDECGINFTVHAYRAQFSLDCLNISLANERPIYPEVLDELIDGLRSMVNAYTWVRRGIEARFPSSEPILVPAAMDDEDRELLDAALFEAASPHDEGL